MTELLLGCREVRLDASCKPSELLPTTCSAPPHYFAQYAGKAFVISDMLNVKECVTSVVPLTSMLFPATFLEPSCALVFGGSKRRATMLCTARGGAVTASSGRAGASGRWGGAGLVAALGALVTHA